MTTVPEVLSISELRQNLAEAMTRVRDAPETAVFVGRQRRPEAVLVSADRYAQLTAADRQEAVASAIGSVRAEGLELSPFGEQIMREVADGRLSFADAHTRILDHYRR